jgi:hypothetical protein
VAVNLKGAGESLDHDMAHARQKGRHFLVPNGNWNESYNNAGRFTVQRYHASLIDHRDDNSGNDVMFEYLNSQS